MSKHLSERMKNILMISLATLLLPGCEKVQDYYNTTVFMVEFSNHAWVIQHSGIMIDSTGYVRKFNLPPAWNWPDDKGFITQDKMEENLAQAEEIICTVTKNDFARFSSKLLKAEEGKLSDPRNEMCDFGTVRYSGFLFDPDTNMYKRILIKQVGDWAMDNSSKEAKDLYEWLKKPCN